jgi:RND superfamily putative drug exporter
MPDAPSRSRQAAAIAISLILLLAMAWSLPSLTRHLTWGGWIPAGAESVQVDARLAREFDRRATSHLVLITPATGDASLGDVASRRELARIAHDLGIVPGVTSVYTPFDAPTAALRANLVADDGDAWLVVVQLDDDLPAAISRLPAIEAAIASDRLDTRLTGIPALSATFGERAKHDLLRAELLALPLALLLLVRFTGGWRAALAIVVTTATALSASLLLVALASRVVTVSIFAVSTVAMLAIALSLDFGLLAALRRSDRDGARHVRATLIIASAAVTAGMAGLALLPVDAARSIGIAGIATVAIVAACQRWLLPSWFALLRVELQPNPAIAPNPSRWLALVGRRPLAALLLGIAALAPLIAPVVALDATGPSLDMLGRDTIATSALDEIDRRFPAVPVAPITIIASPTRGAMTDASNLFSLKQTSERLAQLPGVASIRTVWDLVPGGISSPMLTASLTLDPTLVEQARPLLTPTGAVIEVATTSDAGPRVVELIRSQAGRITAGDLRLAVGGVDAAAVDTVAELGAVALPAAIAVLLGTAIVLAIAFRSVVLPLKAIALNLLPVLAGLGAVTWLFQLGTPWTDGSGATIVLVPLVLAWLMFGVSMDYEVFMLARIREERERGRSNREATLAGVEGARAVVSRGAILMGVVFVAFTMSDVAVVRAIGVGMLVAIAVDATVVRLVLLPASMLLLGRWNWWWPQWLPARDARLPEAIATGDGQ